MKRLMPTLVLLGPVLLTGCAGGTGTVVVGNGGYGYGYDRHTTHVYPHGVNRYQSGGTRLYMQGHHNASTCYVDCWHQGARPNYRVHGGNRGRANVHIGVGVNAGGSW